MEKLKLKHLAPYLPYGLKAKNCFNESVEIKGVQYGNESCRNELWVFVKDKIYLTGYLYQCKPILRPLSDLTKEIEHNGERFVFSDIYLSNTTIKKILGQEYSTFNNFLNDVDYNSIQLLLKYHFDIFSLIEKDLAIDINTLE